MDVTHQPAGGAFGDRLIERLESGDYDRFEFMVAFAKQSGVLRLKSALENFRAAGGEVSAFVGIDMDGTSSDALTSLHLLTDELHVVHTESASQIFHSKVYVLSGATSTWATVGSNNLTYSGLWRNFESFASQLLDPSAHDDIPRIEALTNGFEMLRNPGVGISRLLADAAAIDELVGAGYLKSEVRIDVAGRLRQQERVRTRRLFPVEIDHPPGPRVRGSVTPAPGRRPAPAPARPVRGAPAFETWIGEVFWAETGAMTSPARNQLDLSMRGRVVSGDPIVAGYADRPGWALGSVAFFGVDPAAPRVARRVTINYNGIDFRDNPVDFPTANGTWRIQLRGTDDLGRPLHQVVGPNGFVRKVLAFRRIDEDYYALSILPANRLRGLRMASTLVARNGSRLDARLYGVFTAAE